MTKIKNDTSIKLTRSRISRSGIHSKTKNSKSKTSKVYKKKYKGQGR